MVRGKTENTVIVGHGPPYDGQYEGTAGFGALYVDGDAPALYVNRANTMVPDWEPASSGGGGGKPDGASWLFPFADAAAADDDVGDDGDLCILLDTGNIIQKTGGTWATS